MPSKNHVPILEKALDILEYISASPDTVSQPELQKALHLPQATCYRIVSTLTARHWLGKRGSKHFDIAPGLASITRKTTFHIEKYRKLQPLMNRVVANAGYSAKFSVQDGLEFINVCTAKSRTEAAVFSEVGFRETLREIASVSTILLAENSEAVQQRIVGADQMDLLREKLAFYHQHNYTFQATKASYHFDTLSIPVRCNERLVGVVSPLSLPGLLAANREEIVAKVAVLLPELAEKADI